MKLFLLTIISLIVIFSSPFSQAEGNIKNEAYVKSIFSATRKAWPVLEKVWETDLYRKLRLVVADDKNAWAIDSENLIKIPYSEIQQRNLSVEYMHYQVIQWPDGRPTLYVGLGTKLPYAEESRFQSERNPVPEIFNVATHEAFHFFVQQNIWRKTESDDDSRATPFPVQAAERYYRNSIIRALYAALDGTENSLGHARYWFDLWKKLHPEDARLIRQTDIIEGSAKYIEVIAEVISQGNILDTMEFQYAFTRKIKDDAISIHTQSDSESYVIGALSGFILNMKERGWQSRVAQGTPPLDILLENTRPVAQEGDKKVASELEHEIKRMNTKLASAIDNFDKAYHYAGATRILICSELSGSYSISQGFFRTESIPHDLMVGLDSSAVWADGSYSLKQVVAAEIHNYSVCKDGDGFMIIYPGRIPPAKDGRLILSTSKISLNIPYPENIDTNRTIHLMQ